MVMNATLIELATEPDPADRLTANEYRVRDLLIGIADDDGEIVRTTVELAEILHMQQADVSRALTKLRRLDLVTKVRNGLYRLTAKTARSRTQANRIRAEVERQAAKRRGGLRVVGGDANSPTG